MSYYDRNLNYRENALINSINFELKKHLYKYLGNKRLNIDEIKISHNIISNEPYYKEMKKNLDPEFYDINIDKSKLFNYEKEDLLSKKEIKKINKENEIKKEKKIEIEKKDEFRVSKKIKKLY